MDDAQLTKRLDDLGTPTTIDELRRYAAQGLIAAPPIRYQRRRKKVGKPPNSVKAAKEGRILQEARLGRLPRDWPEQALEEAAAVWSMRYCNGNVCPKGEKIPPKEVTREWINTVKQFAQDVYVRPHPFYRLIDRMIDDIWPDKPFTYKDVEMKLDKDDTLHRLTVTYIAALEKARRGIPMKQPMRIILKRDILEREHILLPEFLSKAHLDRMLAKAAKHRGRKLTRDEVRQVKQLHESLGQTSPGVSSDLDIDLESTDAGCDGIVLKVRQPGEKEWMDSRKLAMRCEDESL